MVLIRNWLVYGCLVLLCLLLLILSLAPPVVRWQAESWLEAQGLEAEFRHLSVSLGRGRIELAGLSGRDSDGNGFGLQRLVLDVALLPLLKQHFIVESFEIDGLSLDVNRLPSDTLVGGLSLASFSASPAVQPKREPESAPEADLGWSLTLERLRLVDLTLCVARDSATGERLAKHCLKVAKIEVKGGLQLPSLQRSTLQLPNELNIFGLKVDDAERQLKVFSIDALGVQGVDFEAEQLELQRLSLQNLVLFERKGRVAERFGSHAALGELQLRQLKWRPEALDVKSLSLEDLMLLLNRDRKARPVLTSWLGRLNEQFGQPSDVLAEVAATPAEPSSIEAAPAASSTIHLQRFTVGGKSSITLLDEAVQPQLEQSLSDLSIELSNIDSRDLQQSALLNVTGRLGEFGRLKLGGKLWPFRDTLSLELVGDIEALDLLPFSPYLEQTIGYQVQTGQLNQQLKLTIKDDILEAKAELELDKLYLHTLSEARRSGSAAAVGGSEAGAPVVAKEGEATLLPIGVALNLLRDTDDKIQLTLPVSGHVDEPSLSVNHVLGVVMRKAMTAAVLNYYAPFGLIDLATMLAKSATALKFEPFVFAPGVVEVGPSQAPRLAKFSQLLGEKPQLSLSLCGSATGNDALSLLQLPQVPATGLVLTPDQRQQLQGLVSLRLKGVKSILIQQGVSARQLVLCQPTLALDQLTDPEVEVNL